MGIDTTLPFGQADAKLFVPISPEQPRPELTPALENPLSLIVKAKSPEDAEEPQSIVARAMQASVGMEKKSIFAAPNSLL